MIIYCDMCAREHHHQITPTKEIGGCQLCGLRVGKMNVVDDKHLKKSSEEKEVAGFRMKEVDGFLKGTRIPLIEPHNHKVVGKGVVLFYDQNKIILARTDTGEKVQISL